MMKKPFFFRITTNCNGLVDAYCFFFFFFLKGSIPIFIQEAF